MPEDRITISKGILVSIIGFLLISLITVAWQHINYRINEHAEVATNILKDSSIMQENINESLIEIKYLREAINKHIIETNAHTN
jgi:hypothetical protein